jgi:hypothetical protein
VLKKILVIGSMGLQRLRDRQYEGRDNSQCLGVGAENLAQASGCNGEILMEHEYAEADEGCAQDQSGVPKCYPLSCHNRSPVLLVNRIGKGKIDRPDTFSNRCLSVGLWHGFKRELSL